MIDLRSDTITLPTPAMRSAMASAPLGDDVFGEDPTVNQLQERVAEMLGKEAALFVSSGTMGNQLAVRAHCQAGDELLCDDQCHIYHYEQAAYAQLFGVAAQPVPTTAGLPEIEQLTGRVRGTDQHHPRTRLLCLENTHNRHGGVVLPQAPLEAVAEWAATAGLALHLDGARLWNAAVATGRSVQDLAGPFDTVSVCFSKGLGAPVGSVLAGSQELIAQAHRTRKALGGGTRQAGILAAAALHALDHHLPLLEADHQKADLLRRAVSEARYLTEVLPPTSNNATEPVVLTNLVYFEVDSERFTGQQFCQRLQEQGVRMLALSPQRVRAVTHLSVSHDEVERAASILLELGS